MQLAVSTVIFALRAGADGSPTTLWLPLVRRVREPYLGQWALPGGPLEEGLGLAEAARQTLRETTGFDPRYLEQLYAFGGLDRATAGADADADRGAEHPTGAVPERPERPERPGRPGRPERPETAERVVSIVYWALVRAEEDARAVVGDNTRWFPALDLPPLAFDHAGIVGYAVARLRAKLSYTPIAHAFVPDEFTLAELREVYEAVLGPELDHQLDPANFRRQILASAAVEPTGRKVLGASHRPPRLYRYRPDAIATSPTPPPRSTP